MIYHLKSARKPASRASFCSVFVAASGSTAEVAPVGFIIPSLRRPKSHRPRKHRRATVNEGKRFVAEMPLQWQRFGSTGHRRWTVAGVCRVVAGKSFPRIIERGRCDHRVFNGIPLPQRAQTCTKSEEAPSLCLFVFFVAIISAYSGSHASGGSSKRLRGLR